MIKFLIEYFLIIFIGVGIIWKIVLPAFGVGTFLWNKKKKVVEQPKQVPQAKQEPEVTAFIQVVGTSVYQEE